MLRRFIVPYTIKENIDQAKTIEEIFIPLLSWFKDNETKIKPNKSHLLLSGNKDRPVNIGNNVVKKTQNE